MKSYLENYLTYCGKNETPEMFNVWSGLTVLGAAVNRRFYLRCGKLAIYPNLYTILTGQSGNGKSLALSNAQHLASQLMEYVNLTCQVETPQSFCRWLAEQAPSYEHHWPNGIQNRVRAAFIIGREFENYIAFDIENWNSTLTSIYECDRFHYRSKEQGEQVIEAPCVSVLGSAQSVARVLPTLQRRCIIQPGTRQWSNPTPFPDDSPEQKEALEQCIQYIKELIKAPGEVGWTDAAKEFYSEDYKTTRQPNESHLLLKVGLILTLSSAQVTMTKEHLLAAKEFLAKRAIEG